MQERYRKDPWALLVGCIIFNMVHGKKAQPIHEEFLRRWPNAIALFKHSTKADLVELFRPLGFQNRRADRIQRMSLDFLAEVMNEDEFNLDVTKLHGIGKYGSDSYNIFCRGYLVEDARDKELRNYVSWALGEGTGGVLQADPTAPHTAGQEPPKTIKPESSDG